MNARDESSGIGATLAKVALAVLLLVVAILVTEFTGRQFEQGQTGAVKVEENSLSRDD